jgi:hypothetical protein
MVMMRKGLASCIVAVCVVLLACNVVLAAPPQPPWMGFYGTVTGIPSGGTTNIEIVNASGAVVSTSTSSDSWGSPSSPLKVYGSFGNTLLVRINGHQVATWGFDDPGAIVSKTLAYPVIASITPSGGGSYTFGNGAIGQDTVTPTPTSTATPTQEPSPMAMPTPTPTPGPSQQPQESNLSWWLLLVLIAILVIGAAAYLLWRKK